MVGKRIESPHIPAAERVRFLIAIPTYRAWMCRRAESLSARVAVTADTTDYLHDDGYGSADHLMEKAASESDNAFPNHTEFVMQGSF